ncbi:MAG: DUF3617 domain-containing protein [Sphingomonadales bacterium]|jgi:hypothetical protein|nr:DUF3617 domain-containing protein [Sphingomonadales bacterium]
MRPVIAVLTLLALTGCNKSDEPKKAESVLIKREPGAWKTDIKLVKLDMPGAPKEMVDVVTAAMGRLKGVETCLTAEQAAKEDIAKALAKAPDNKGECTFDKKEIGSGQLDVVMTCTDAATKESMTISTKGTVAAKLANVRMTMVGKQNGMPMTLELDAANVWSGPCKS